MQQLRLQNSSTSYQINVHLWTQLWFGFNSLDMEWQNFDNRWNDLATYIAFFLMSRQPDRDWPEEIKTKIKKNVGYESKELALKTCVKFE